MTNLQYTLAGGLVPLLWEEADIWREDHDQAKKTLMSLKEDSWSLILLLIITFNSDHEFYFVIINFTFWVTILFVIINLTFWVTIRQLTWSKAQLSLCESLRWWPHSNCIWGDTSNSTAFLCSLQWTSARQGSIAIPGQNLKLLKIFSWSLQCPHPSLALSTDLLR